MTQSQSAANLRLNQVLQLGECARRSILNLQSNIWHSLLKEHTSYRKEAEQQQRKLDGFIAAKADDWDVGNAVCYTISGRLER